MAYLSSLLCLTYVGEACVWAGEQGQNEFMGKQQAHLEAKHCCLLQHVYATKGSEASRESSLGIAAFHLSLYAHAIYYYSASPFPHADLDSMGECHSGMQVMNHTHHRTDAETNSPVLCPRFQNPRAITRP